MAPPEMSVPSNSGGIGQFGLKYGGNGLKIAGDPLRDTLRLQPDFGVDRIFGGDSAPQPNIYPFSHWGVGQFCLKYGGNGLKTPLQGMWLASQATTTHINAVWAASHTPFGYKAPPLTCCIAQHCSQEATWSTFRPVKGYTTRVLMALTHL